MNNSLWSFGLNSSSSSKSSGIPPTDEAIAGAVKLSNRFIQDRYLPDKAIDLLDETGSKKNLTIQALDPKVIEERLKHAEQQKEAASKEEDFEKAAYYRDQVKKLTDLKEKQVADEDIPTVTIQDMEQVVETMTGIPYDFGL